jgi:hypothetical protein
VADTTAAFSIASAPPALPPRRGGAPSYDILYDAPAVALSTATLKLLHDAPTALPRSGLRPAVARAFSAAPRARPLLALEATAQPGCTLLTVYAVTDAPPGADADADAGADAGAADVPMTPDAVPTPMCARAAPWGAASALRAMLSEPGAAGAFLRSRRHVRLTDDRGDTAAAAQGQILLPAQPEAADAPSMARARVARLPAASPLAALCTAPVALTWHSADVEMPAGCADHAPARVRCVLHGQLLRFADGAPTAALRPGRGATALRASGGVEGAGLLCLEDDARSASGAAPMGTTPPYRVLLLCRDAAIVAEIARTEAALPAGDDVARTRVEAALLALGHALRPGCSPALGARAAAAAIAHGWRAAAARVLSSLAIGTLEADKAAAAHASGDGYGGDDDDAVDAADEAAREPFLLPGGVSLLHCAAACGSGWGVRAVLRAGGVRALFGAPHVRCRTAAAATPLHAAAAATAARLEDAEALDALAALTEPPAGAVAWLGARCGGAGATPSEVAFRAAAAAAASAAASAPLRALDGALRRRVAGGAAAAASAVEVLSSEFAIFLPGEQAAFGPALLRARAAAPPLAGHAPEARAIADALFRAAAASFDAPVARDLAILLPTPPASPSPAPPASASPSPLPPLFPTPLRARHGAAADVDDELLDAPLLPFAGFLLHRGRRMARLWALATVVYILIVQLRLPQSVHAALAALAQRAQDAEDAGGPPGELFLNEWQPGAAALFRAIIGTWHQLLLQVPVTLALLAPLLPGAPAALRAAQRRHARAILCAQHLVHLVGAGVFEALLLSRALPHTRVVWPVRMSLFCAIATVMAHLAWPLPARASAVVLALRAAPILLAATAAAPVWLHTPPAGVALQLSACVASAGIVALRERRMAPQYAAHVAAHAAHAEAVRRAAAKARKAE